MQTLTKENTKKTERLTWFVQISEIGFYNYDCITQETILELEGLITEDSNYTKALRRITIYLGPGSLFIHRESYLFKTDPNYKQLLKILENLAKYLQTYLTHDINKLLQFHLNYK